MKARIDALNGATIQSIEVLTDEDTNTNKGEYGSYEYLITTDKGVLRLSGCHDDAGYVEISDGVPDSDNWENIKFVHLPGR